MTGNIIYNLKNHPIPVIFVAVITILLTVLVMQYFFDINPCKMCYYQRYPYYLILVLIPFYFFKKEHEKIILIIISLLLFSTAIIASYHIAIERNIIATAPNCASNNQSFSDSHELLNHLTGKKAVACDVPAFKLVFTLSEWNLIVAIILLVYGLTTYIKRNKQQ